MTRLAEHHFVTRDMQPIDHFICRGCRFPHVFCACNPEDDDLPEYVGSDPTLYPKEKN
jgi:hypothetical protein